MRKLVLKLACGAGDPRDSDGGGGGWTRCPTEAICELGKERCILTVATHGYIAQGSPPETGRYRGGERVVGAGTPISSDCLRAPAVNFTHS